MRIKIGHGLAVLFCAAQLHPLFAQSIVTQNTLSSVTQTLNRGCGTPTLPVAFETWIQSFTQAPPKKTGGGQTQSVFNIPVIVHIVHNNQSVNNATATSGSNLNAAQIYDQINILNRDFNAQNPDTNLVPTVFKPLIGNFQFNFCLAVVNPTGGVLTEPGIDRINRVSKGWNAPPYSQNYMNTTVKPNSIWDPTRYLNMWVCDLSGGILGFATFPNPGSSGLSGLSPPYGGLTNDGVVMDDEAFGSIGTAVTNTPYHKGRTTVHEVGHWLGLRHIWGDGTCATDYCADTPPAQQANYNCPTHPYKSGTCTGNTTGEMFMNYMDYTNDVCMYMFSKDQKNRAQLIMTNSSLRASLLTSTVCNLPTATNEIGIQYVLAPTYSQVINCNNVITPSVVIHNFGTNTVTSATYSYNINGAGTQTVAWTGTLTPGTSATVVLPAISNIPNGTHQYNVGVYLPNGSSDTYTTNNYNNQQFSVVNSYTMAITGSTLSCSGAPVTLTVQSPANSYTWQPGNITGSVVSFTPAVSTVYTLTASNGSCVNTRTFNVSALPSPTVTLNSPTVCAGSPAALGANGACTYTWLPGGLSGSNLTVTPLSTTHYTLIGQGCNGCAVTRIATVTVNQNPTVTVITAPAGSLCAGGSATLTAVGAGSYSWSTGSNSPSIVVSPTTNTTYSLLGSQSGCSASTSAVVNVGSNAFSIMISPNPATVCTGNVLNLVATGASSYSWSNGTNGSGIAITPTANSVFTVNGTNGACTASTVVNVSVLSYPSLSVSVHPSASVCAGTSVTLTAQGAASYIWDQTNPGATNIVTVVSPATFTVSGDQSGCVSTQTVSVSVTGSTLGLTASAQPASICPGGSVTLSATGASSYTWNGAPGAGTQVVIPTSTTTYTLTGSDGPCIGMATVEVTVIPAPPLVISGHNATVCPGKSAVIVASGPYTSYSWLPGSVNGTAFIAAPVTSSSYTVTGTGSPSGCSTTSVFAISVAPAPVALINVTNTPCNEPCEGTFDATVSAGTAPYSFSIAGAPCTSLPCTGLCPALYTLYTTDANGCESVSFFSVECYVKESVADLVPFEPHIFPNPARQSFEIQLPGLFSYVLSDGLGRLMRQDDRASGSAFVDVTGLSAGVYMLTIRNGSGSTTKKIIKE